MTRFTAALARVRPIARKEYLHIIRDWRALTAMLFFPGALLVLFGYALNFDVRHVALAVLDHDRSPTSREFIQRFANSGYFDLKAAADHAREVDELLDRGQARVVLVIPPDFGKTLAGGRAVTVQADIDGSNPQIGAAVLGFVTAVCRDYSGLIIARALSRSGLSLSQPISFRPRIWFNPELRSVRFLVPGLIAFILMLTAVISISLSIVREKESGTMEQVIVSPVRAPELLLGKTLPYLVISLLAALGVLGLGALLFGVTVKGSLLWLVLAILLFLVGGLGLGLFISTLTDSQQMAYMLSALLTMLPTALLSGFIFPIQNMPDPIQVFTYLIPARYFLVILRGIVLKGSGIAALWSQFLFLAGFAALVVGLGIFRMSRQLTRGIA